MKTVIVTVVITLAIVMLPFENSNAFPGYKFKFDVQYDTKINDYKPLFEVEVTEWEDDGVFDGFVEVDSETINYKYENDRLKFDYDSNADLGLIYYLENDKQVYCAYVNFFENPNNPAETKIEALIDARDVFKKITPNYKEVLREITNN